MTNQQQQQKEIELFNRDIDTILAGQTPPKASDPASSPKSASVEAEYNELIGLARTLATIQFTKATPPKKIYQLSRYRVTQTQTSPNSRRNQRRRLVACALAILFVVNIGLLLPPGQSFAQNILRWIGVVKVSQEPAEVVKIVGFPTQGPVVTQPTSMPENLPTVAAPQPRSLAEVSRRAGFTALAPSYLPYDLKYNDRNAWQILDKQKRIAGWQVSSFYSNGGDVTTTYPYSYLDMAQSRYNSGADLEEGLGKASANQVTVRGQQGLWVEQGEVITHNDGNDGTITEKGNMLLWEEDGFIFKLLTNNLSLVEMLKIAASLKSA